MVVAYLSLNLPQFIPKIVLVLSTINGILYPLQKMSNWWLSLAAVFFSMLGNVVALGQPFEGPTLSSRRLQNITAGDGTVQQIVQGIFSNNFGKSCRDEYLKVLGDTDEFEKLGSSAATTVMALIPAMIVFASIPIASIRSLGFISNQLALFTSALTLGLKIDTQSTLNPAKRGKASELLKDSVIADLGIQDGISPQPSTKDLSKLFELLGVEDDSSGEPDSVAEKGTEVTIGSEGDVGKDPGNSIGEGVGGDLGEGTNNKSKRRPGIYEKKEPKKPRPSILYIFTLIWGYNLFQIVLFGTLVRALPKIENILFIWACPEQSSMVFNAWLAVTAMLSATARTISANHFSAKKDEVLYISLLGRKDLDRCSTCSALVKRPRARSIWRLLRLWNSAGVRNQDSLSYNGGLLGLIMTFTMGTYTRQHPLIVVLRDSSDLRTPSLLKLTLSGFLQAVSIGLLTIMFGSMWGGSLMWTTLFVTAFIFIIWVSRTTSLFVCKHLEEGTGMTVILCDTRQERWAIRRAIISIPGALVDSKSRGYKYWDGHNVGTNCKDHLATSLSPDTVLGTKVRMAGFLSGIVVGLFSGMGIFLSFFVATLPYNAPFIPHPRTWLHYPIAFVVAMVIAVAFWVNYISQEIQFSNWGYLYNRIERVLDTPTDPINHIDLEARDITHADGPQKS